MTVRADSPLRFTEVAEKWRSRRDEFARLNAQVNAAPLIDEMLADIDEVLAVEAQDRLTIAEAAARSGYAPDSLRKLVAGGVIPNAGRKGAPLIAARDVPAKPARRVASCARSSYDPATDARLLGSRRSGGRNGS